MELEEQGSGPWHRLYPWESGLAQRQKGRCQSSQSASPVCLAGPRHRVRIHRCSEASEPVGGLSVGLTHADDKLDPAEGPLPLWPSLIGLGNTRGSLSEVRTRAFPQSLVTVYQNMYSFL